MSEDARLRIDKDDDTPDEPAVTVGDETSENKAKQPDGPEGAPAFVTNIASIEQQVGMHVIRALQHEDAAGVLTVAQAGPQGQRLVSLPIDEDQLGRFRR